MKMHISHTQSFNIPVSIALVTLAHMINVYKICLNTTNFPIFNMHDIPTAGIPTMLYMSSNRMLTDVCGISSRLLTEDELKDL